MNIAETTRVPSLRTTLFLCPLIGVSLGLTLTAPESPSRLDLTVTYTGPEEVDDQHPITVLLFDGPDLSGGSKMLAAGHLTKNGGTLSWTDLPEMVYAAAIFDPLGSFTGLSGMIPGSAVGAYALDGATEPSPIEVFRHTRVSFEFDDALEFARRAGVAIYGIGLQLNKKQYEARRKLSRIAEETGGRTFFIDDIAELEAIYADIQRELRSRYLLAYQSSNTSGSRDFRTIEVEVDGSGLEAKTMRGYYP